VTKCITGAEMAKKRISSVELSWLISEELLDLGSLRARAALAVVPDKEHGWRVVVANRVRRFLTPADAQRLAEIVRNLRLVYEIRP
jgi:hypothetical protein